jgi:hypothetical protein
MSLSYTEEVLCNSFSLLLYKKLIGDYRAVPIQHNLNISSLFLISENEETKWRLGVEPEEAEERAVKLSSKEDRDRKAIVSLQKSVNKIDKQSSTIKQI